MGTLRLRAGSVVITSLLMLLGTAAASAADAPPANRPKPIEATETKTLKKLAGKELTVHGTVLGGVKTRAGATLFTFTDGEKGFVAVVPKEDFEPLRAEFGGKLRFAGKELLLTGKIEMYRGLPQMLLRKRAQIVVVGEDKPPASAAPAAPANPPPQTEPKTSSSPPLTISATRNAVTAPAAALVRHPAVEEIRRLIDQGEYANARKGLAPLLQRKGADLAGFDRYELFTLRAECELYLGERAAAQNTLRYVEKECAAVGNLNAAGPALALAVLIRSSPGDVYVPLQGNDHAGRMILDRSIRKELYARLFDDQFAIAQKQIADAKSQRSLKQVLEVAHNLYALRGLDRASAGSSERADSLVPDLISYSSKLIASTLDDYDIAVPRMRKAAERIVNDQKPGIGKPDVNGRAPVRPVPFPHPWGVTINDAKALENIAINCDAIPAAIAQFITAFGDPFAYDGLAARAANVRLEAMNLLNRDFGEGTVPGIRLLKP